MIRASEIDRGNHISHARTPGDHLGMFADACVPNLTGLIVAGIRRLENLTVKCRPERLDIDNGHGRSRIVLPITKPGKQNLGTQNPGTDGAITVFYLSCVASVVANVRTTVKERPFGHVAKARGMAQIAKESGLGRERLYNTLAHAHTHASQPSTLSCTPW